MNWIDRQLPKDDEVFLDHIGFFVADMEEAAQAFQRLGFTISEQNTHYNTDATGTFVPAGTVNRLITLDWGYLEVLAASGDTPLADQLRQGLARYPGLHLIAFGHGNVPSLEPGIRSKGIELQPTVNLRRPIQTPKGEAIVGFTVLRAAPGAMAEGRVQFCQHLTPEHVWRPGMSDHANGAKALSDLLIVTADEAATTQRYERFTGRMARNEGSRTVIHLDRGLLSIANPVAAGKLLPGFRAPSLPYLAAVTLRCSDLDLARRTLATNGIRPVVDREDRIIVCPDDGLGAWIQFAGPA